MELLETTLYTVPNEMQKAVIVDADWNEKYGVILVSKENNKFFVVINGDIIYPRLKVKYPLIRWVNEQQFVIINARNHLDTDNCYLVNRSGEVTTSFNCGDAIEDLVPNKEGIWVSYFDEGVFGDGISTEGLVLFSYEGKPLFRFHTDLPERLVIDDCYAICKASGTGIWLCPYGDFDLIHIDKNKKVAFQSSVPDKVKGSSAMCVRHKYVYFFSPYDKENELYAWEIGKGKPTKVGNLNGNVVRGLGPRETKHFICCTDRVVSVIEIQNIELNSP